MTATLQAFFATCPKGLEYLLVDELSALGAQDVPVTPEAPATLPPVVPP